MYSFVCKRQDEIEKLNNYEWAHFLGKVNLGYSTNEILTKFLLKTGRSQINTTEMLIEAEAVVRDTIKMNEPNTTFPDNPDKTKINWYRVRKTWTDSKSQKGAFKILENAKKCADANQGYKVFDADGNIVYEPKTITNVPYLIKVDIPDLNIRTGPAVSYSRTGQYTGIGVFTIVEEKDGWGRLKSGAGWICLAYTKRI